MTSLEKGPYIARCTRDPADIARAQALRARCFGLAEDSDPLDGLGTHVLIEERAGGLLVGCYRLLRLAGPELGRSYAARYYDLAPLRAFEGPMLELGRFCIAPGRQDPDILRLAWALMTRLVDREGVRLLFGCSSFAGTDPAPYEAAYALLRARHLGPECWRPRARAAEIHRFPESAPRPEPRQALQAMPPLLRTYLTMGGWVSDHAVVDRQLNTQHVFTGVETGAIPAARKRLLRALV
jgi:putative hemolysin